MSNHDKKDNELGKLLKQELLVLLLQINMVYSILYWNFY